MFDNWQALMASFGFADNLLMHKKLLLSYGERHRHYHNFSHISACLKHLDKHQHYAKHANEIALALWFHDAVYQVFSKTNEHDSAEMAKDFLLEQKADSRQIQRVYNLIMATKAHGLAKTADEALMVDIDLSILGAPFEVYQRYEEAVQKEYQQVPKFIFSYQRKKVLKQFLKKPRLYQTEIFYVLYEKPARENLAWAIGRL